MMDDGRECDDKGHERCLHTGSKNDAFDLFVCVSPNMKALECPKRLVWCAGMHELEGVG
jgi:hypothetical protein